jgi:hypothetical protein
MSKLSTVQGLLEGHCVPQMVKALSGLEQSERGMLIAIQIINVLIFFTH